MLRTAWGRDEHYLRAGRYDLRHYEAPESRCCTGHTASGQGGYTACLRTPKYDSITQEQLKEWKEAFEKRAAEDYYAEWFWFTYQKKIWVNSWKNTTDGTDFLDYPNGADTFLQWLQGWIGGVMTDTSFFQALPGAWQAQLLATLGLAVLPPTVGEDATPTYKTLLPNALHFRRGVSTEIPLLL